MIVIIPRPQNEITPSAFESSQELYWPPSNDEETTLDWHQVDNIEDVIPERLIPHADDVSALPMYYPDNRGNGSKLKHFALTTPGSSDIRLKPNGDNNSITPKYTRKPIPTALVQVYLEQLSPNVGQIPSVSASLPDSLILAAPSRQIYAYEKEQTPPLPPEETRLRQGFAAALSRVDMADILHLLPGREVPRNIGDYALVPLISTYAFARTNESAGPGCQLPPGVTSNYHGKGGKPYLDASIAIGLVFKGTLAAVAAAGVADDGRLRIVQMQDVTEKNTDNPKERFKSGLHSGFYWRDTLVTAWLSIAQELDISTVEIQSAQNSRWNYQKNRTEQLEAGYDKVAERMGFTWDTDTNNWTWIIKSQVLTEA